MAFKLRRYKGTDWFEVDIRLTLPNGEKLRERVKSDVEGKAASKEWAMRREAWLLKNDGAKKAPILEPVVVTRMEEMIPIWEARLQAARLKPGTIKTNTSLMHRYVKKFFGHQDVLNVGKLEIEEAKAFLRTKGPGTVNTVMALGVQLLSLAKEKGLRGSLPLPEIDYLIYTTPEVEPYEPEEYEALLCAAEDKIQRRLICLLGGDAGLRCSEIAALHRVDVDLVHGFLNVKNNLSDNKLDTPKTRKSKRRIELTQRLREALRTQLKSHAAPTVCIWKDGAMFTRWQVAREIRHVEKKAGLVPRDAGVFACVHKLRHTFGTRLAAKGATTKEIAELMGHESTQTTEIYLHLAKVDRGRAIRLLDGDIVEKRK